MPEWGAQAPLAGLVFARCGAMLAVAPPLNLRQFPLTVRLGLAAVLATALVPAAGVAAEVGTPGLGLYAALLVGEACVGLLLGFCAALVFYAFTIAGQLLDALLGAGEAGARAAGQGPLGGFTHVLAAAVLVGVDGHHWVLRALGETLRLLPLGSGLDLSGVTETLACARAMLGTGLAIAAPALAALYAAEVSLAVFDRVAPGLGLAGAAAPVRWTATLLGFAVSLPLFGVLVREHGARAVQALLEALALLTGP